MLQNELKEIRTQLRLAMNGVIYQHAGEGHCL